MILGEQGTINGAGETNKATFIVYQAYDAMTSKRVYSKNVLSKEEALQELKDNSGKQFNLEIMGIFLKDMI